MKTTRRFASLWVSFFLAGCAQLPFLQPKPTAASPTQAATRARDGEFTAEARADEAIGEITPVFINLRGNSETPRRVSPSRIVGITGENKIKAAIAPDTAAAGFKSAQPNIWLAMLAQATTEMAAGTVLGGGVGAVAGSVGGLTVGPMGVGIGAAAGGAIGAAIGAVTGAISGARRAYREHSATLAPVAVQLIEGQLAEQTLWPANETTGYIFLPKDSYTHLKLLLTTESDGDVEITVPVTTASDSDS